MANEGGRRRKLKPERLGAGLEAMLPEPVRRNLPGWRGVLAWADVVGRDAAARSRAVSFRDGRLRVEVAGSVWMHHLLALKPQLLAKVNRATGSEEQVIRDIVFVLDPGLSGPGRPHAA